MNAKEFAAKVQYGSRWTDAELAAIKNSNLVLGDVVHAFLATPKTDTTPAKPPALQKPARLIPDQ